MSWNAPSWPKPAPRPTESPRLTALLDAVDAFLAGALDRDGLQVAWRQAKNPKP